ncbi:MULTISPECIES: hypothetical protein [unclassified Blastococcus]
MPALSPAIVCRTVVVLAFLVPLAAAGTSAGAAAGLALALVALWLAPLLVARPVARRPVEAPAAGLVLEPAETGAG